MCLFLAWVSEKRTHWASLSFGANSVSSTKNSVSSLLHTNKRPRGTHWVLSPNSVRTKKLTESGVLKPYSPKPYSARLRPSWPPFCWVLQWPRPDLFLTSIYLCFLGNVQPQFGNHENSKDMRLPSVSAKQILRIFNWTPKPDPKDSLLRTEGRQTWRTFTLRRFFAPPSMRNRWSQFSAFFNGLPSTFSATFNPFRSIACYFQSVSVSFDHFESVSLSLTQSKTQEFIDNQKVGKTTRNHWVLFRPTFRSKSSGTF